MKEMEIEKSEEPIEKCGYGRYQHRTLPPAQGLYDPANEHDACGMGFVVNIQGHKSHEIIRQGLTVLNNMTHRGASGSEVNTGDGAGIMLQIPHTFLQKATAGFVLPEPETYGVGMLFLSHDPGLQQQCKQQLAQIVAEEGQHLLGWRAVPTNNRGLGEAAKAGEPSIHQVFIQQNSDLQHADPQAFERKLYLIRKRAEHEIGPLMGDQPFYFAGLSSRTIVYKGMLTPEQLKTYYPDLSDPEMVS
ncbi:MAG: hypothetical protein KC421_26780, partial [Anaerolineales bacterium]|nr:hypothetical protein [Anaerolineales bacterium]